MKRITSIVICFVIFSSFLSGFSTIYAKDETPEISNITNDFMNYFGNSPNVINGEHITADTKIYSYSENNSNVNNKDIYKKLGKNNFMENVPQSLFDNATTIDSIDITNNTIVSQLSGDIIWLVNSVGKSKPYFLRKNEVYWVNEDTIEQGGELKIFGVGFGKKTIAILKNKDKYIDVTENLYSDAVSGRDFDRYLLNISTPNNLELGNWELYLNNGENSFNWVKACDINVTKKTNKDYKKYIDKGTAEINGVYNIKSFGAKGDGISNDTKSIKKAVAKAVKKGGIVFFPPGVYMVDETLILPQGVKAVGSGAEQTVIEGYGYDPAINKNVSWFSWNCNNNIVPYSVVYLNDKTGLEGLTIKGAVNKGIGGYGMVQLGFKYLNIKNTDANQDCAIIKCNLISEDQSSLTNDRIYRNALYSAGSVKKLKLLNCDITGTVHLGGYGGIVERSEIIDNVIRGGLANEIQAIDITAADCLIDSNRFVDSPGRVVINPLRHCYIRYNELLGMAKGTSANSTEGFLSHGKNSYVERSLGYVSSADKNSLVDKTAKFEKGIYKNAVLVITYGKGKGQYRFIKDNTKDKLILNEPFNVIPDNTSEYTVGFFFTENVFFGNINDSIGHFNLWNDSIANIVENYRDDRGGMALDGVDTSVVTQNDNRVISSAFALCWYNVISNCWLDGSNITLNSLAQVNSASNAVPFYANTITNGYINMPANDRNGFSGKGAKNCSIAVGGESQKTSDRYDQAYTILFGNSIENSRVGIDISKESYKTIVLRNIFENVDVPISNNGGRTIINGNKKDFLTDSGKIESIKIEDVVSDSETMISVLKTKYLPQKEQYIFSKDVNRIMTFVSSLTHNDVSSDINLNKCQVNLKELWKLIIKFQDKYNVLPVASFYPENPDGDDNIIRMLGQEAFEYGICPSFSKEAIGKTNIEYVWNAQLNGQKLSNIKDPSETWVLMDMSGMHEFMCSNGFAGHKHGINVLYADGKVKHLSDNNYKLNNLLKDVTFIDKNVKQVELSYILYTQKETTFSWIVPTVILLAILSFSVLIIVFFKRSRNKKVSQ